MSSFLWPDSTTRRLYNQGLTREEFDRRQERMEANRKAKEEPQQMHSILNDASKFVKSVFSSVKKFFSRRKH